MHTQGQRSCEDGGRDWSDTSPSQERQPPPEASVIVLLQLSETDTAGEPQSLLSTGIPGEAEETPRRLLYD